MPCRDPAPSSGCMGWRAAKQLDRHAQCALRGWPGLAATCKSDGFVIQGKELPGCTAGCAWPASSTATQVCSCCTLSHICESMPQLLSPWRASEDDDHMQLRCSEGCAMSLHSPACWGALKKELKQQHPGFALKVCSLCLLAMLCRTQMPGCNPKCMLRNASSAS